LVKLNLLLINMAIALITGSNGLVGSESAYFFAKKGFDIVGIDNNLREVLFW
jgi:CDP-paratose 2-epimerase